MNILRSLLRRLFRSNDTTVTEVPKETELPKVIISDKPPLEVPQVNSKDYTTLPLPSKDGSMEAAVPLLKAVESITGVNAKTLALIVNLESTFRTNVKARTSSALGWFQLINGTYAVLLERYGSKYNIPAKPTKELRTDPRVSSLLGAELLTETSRIIRPVLGREPTVLESYMGHFLGAPVAKKFLAIKDPNTIAADIMLKEAKANPWVFYENNGKGPARTVAQVNQSITSRIATSMTQVDKYFN